MSQELYGEVLTEKGKILDSKLTYTPAKINAQIGKVNLSYTARGALHFNGDGIKPQVETLTTAAVPLTKNNKLSAYCLLQTYDTFRSINKDNVSFNVGFSYLL